MKKKLSIITCITGVAAYALCASAYAETTLDFVELDGNISESNYNTIVNSYCEIPLNVRENFQLAGWDIIMTSSRLEDVYPEFKDLTICALTDPVKQTIWLEDTKNGANAIVHEVGHYVACSNDTLPWDATSEWFDIWENEKSRISKYAKTNAAEGFAEAFEQCILHPSSFQKKCPESYAFITSICEGLEGAAEDTAL